MKILALTTNAQADDLLQGPWAPVASHLLKDVPQGRIIT